MTTAVNNEISNLEPVKVEPPKGKFTAFCDWMRDNKREIAIALIVVGIAAFVFGLGVVISLLPIVHFGTAQLASFAATIFNFKGLTIIGISEKGKLFFAAIGSVIVGAGMAGYGGGILSGLPKKN